MFFLLYVCMYDVLSLGIVVLVLIILVFDYGLCGMAYISIFTAF